MADVRQWQGHAGVILDSRGEFDVIDCGPCRFKHIVPIPSEAALRGLYQDDYYAREKPLYLEQHQQDLPWWNVVHGERYDTLEELLPQTRRRIIEIGSGPGFFLLHGKQRGWTTVGIEPAAQAAAHGRALGLEVIEEFFAEDLIPRLGTFDAVHLSDVLEHVPDPAHLLTLARRLLGPGGVICVAVPNDYNPFQSALRSACGYPPWWLAPPHHINYFDFSSLAGLLERGGFEIVLREATFPIDLFLLMGDNYVGNDALGRQCHGKRKQLELNLDRAGLRMLKRQWYRQLAQLGIGREIVLYCRVPSSIAAEDTEA